MQIGQGTYSTVYKARDVINQKFVALKKVRFDNLDPESLSYSLDLPYQFCFPLFFLSYH